ncbi:MAG: flagellar motor switch protein FliN [Planctomycetota bacterium]|nr:flagellar motor switch protein FliN [Planctomycetota bacterium]
MADQPPIPPAIDGSAPAGSQASSPDVVPHPPATAESTPSTQSNDAANERDFQAIAQSATFDNVTGQSAADASQPDTFSAADIDELLKQAESGAGIMDDPSVNAPAGISDDTAIEELLKQANFEDAPGDTPAPDAETFRLPSFQQVMADAQVSSIDLLRDVELNVKIELGRSRMLVEDVLKLSEGSVVELDKLAGDPVDVFVNERLVARGEVLVLNDNFCVRVNEIVAGVKEEAL